MVYNFFDKKTKGSGIVNNKENIQLADKLQKPIIRKFKKRKVYSGFKDNIWGGVGGGGGFGWYAVIE